MNKNFSYDLFRKALSRKGFNTNSFSDKTKIPLGTIGCWKNVKSIKKIKYIEAIEKYLEVKYEDLCVEGPRTTHKARDNPVIESPPMSCSDINNTILWPIIGRAAGGPWIATLETSEYTTFADSYMPVSTTFNDPNGYALTVVGESMAPVLPDGTEIAVSPNRPARNGDIAVIFVLSEVSDQPEVCVKRFYYSGQNNESVRLVSYNPAFSEIVLPATKILKTHRVVEWRVVVK